MACQGCKRQLLLLARQINAPPKTIITAELYSTHQFLRRFNTTTTTTTTTTTIEQRRGFRSTSRRTGFLKSVRDTIGQVVSRSSEPYKVIAATQGIYKICSKEAAYTIDPIAIKAGTIPLTADGEHMGKGEGMWFDEFNLPPTFSTWAQVTMLHMYLIIARIRNLDRDAAQTWQAQIVDHFFFDAEERMDLNHGISSRALRHRYLKELFVQWRGLIAAYDEGLVKGDAVLASAVWRNLFKAREDVDVRLLAAVVSWMRLSLKMLDQMPDDGLFFRAGSALKWPARNEFAMVDKPVRLLAEQLGSNEPLKGGS
ncbi:hypothetical protein GGS20DRAFT_581230 [Poronia punctata]|nr:hypothetical protein GGS20DRAFT_581230 [Poronia punctata]